MSRHTQDEVRIRERHEEKGKQGREKNRSIELLIKVWLLRENCMEDVLPVHSLIIRLLLNIVSFII